MKKLTLDYALNAGYIHHWLALPLFGEPLESRPTGSETEVEFRQRSLREHETIKLPFDTPPIEVTTYGKRFWEVSHCKEDHLLEATLTAPVWQRLERWAYTQLNVSAAGAATAELAVSCAAAVWLNGSLVFRGALFQPLDQQSLAVHTFPLRFKRGANHLYLQLEDAAQGSALVSAGLRLNCAMLDQTEILLQVQNKEINHRKDTEATYEIAYLSQPVYTTEDTIVIHGADREVRSMQCVVRLQDITGGVRAETFTKLEPGITIPSLGSYQLPPGPMQACIMPPPELFYNQKFQPQRTIPFINAPYRYASQPQGEYEDRLILLAKETARQDGIFGEASKMMLGWWEAIDLGEIRKAIARVNQHAAGCLLDLLGLTGVALRLTRFKKFPAELLPEIEAAITSFPYQPEKALRPLLLDETGWLLLAACQTLAGQKYPKAHFKVSGRTGSKERNQGETAVLALLKQAGQYGWREGHSRLDERVAALAHLADLATDETVAELAAILLDQTAFVLAQYSFQGTFGAPQLRAVSSQLKSGRLAPATSLNYLLFGLGNFNQRLAGSFSLGVAKEYELPELVRGIALEQQSGAWTIEHSARQVEGWEANQATYKTADYLLASLQDYQPGSFGGQVHPWQATLGPEAVVFTSHPTSFLQTDERLAGAWCGSGSLPRIAQWKDALVCLYQLPADDRFGYTHAYFPTFTFDEYRLENGWAFARKGDGYLAIFASNDMGLVELGDDAGCELRANGPQTAWLMQMGQRSTDGNFTDFCASILAHPAKVAGLAVDWETLRGDRLEFGWSGPLRRGGEEWPLSFPKRFEGPFVDAAFPAETMDVGHGDQLMRLSFR